MIYGNSAIIERPRVVAFWPWLAFFDVIAIAVIFGWTNK
jgi:hypothetical protein